MILVDTSVLIDYQRTRDAKLKGLFASLPVAICGATRAELLHGARNPGNRRKLLSFLNTFQQVAIPDAMRDRVGDNLAALRGAGITIPFADVVIITVGIGNGVEVWARPALQGRAESSSRAPTLPGTAMTEAGPFDC